MQNRLGIAAPLALALAVGLVRPLAADQGARLALARDVRLNKAVTVSWKKTSLEEALRELSKATGVRMAPDRRIADEPVMASATNVRASALMEQLATLLHYTWARSGGTPEAPDYRFYQDRAAEQEEQAEIDRAERMVLEALQRELSRYRQLSKLPPERLQEEIDKADREFAETLAGGIAAMASSAQAAQRMQNGMAVRAVASPIGRAMLDLLDSLTPAQWNELREEESLIFSTRPGPGEERLAQDLNARLRGAAPQFPFPKALFQTFAPQAEGALAELEQQMQAQWSQAQEFRVTVQLNLNLTAQPVGILRASPEPQAAEGRPPAGEASMSPAAAMFGISGLIIMAAPHILDEPAEDPAAREQRLAADPVLGRKETLRLPPPPKKTGIMAILNGSYPVAEVLPAVEAAYGVRILGDAYTRQAMIPFQPPGDAKMRLYWLLDRLAGTARRWELDGEFIRFRSKTWAHDRRAEIPARMMRAWLAAREKKGSFSLDNAANIAAALRDEQVESLMYAAMEQGTEDAFELAGISGSAGILRFYARLHPLQRQRLLSGQAIAVRALLPDQQAALLRLNRQQNRSLMSFAFGVKPRRRPEELAAAVLTLERKGQAPPEGPGGATRGRGPAPQPRTSAGMFVFRVAFPDSQKDEYTVMVGATGRSPTAKPAAPPPPQ
jgi:hypothetical protein